MSIDKTLKQQITKTPRAAGEQPFSALPDLAVPDDGTIVPAVDSGINYTFSLAALKKFVKSQMSKTVFFDASVADSYSFSVEDLEQHEKIRVVMTALPADDRELTLFFPIAWDSSQGIKVEVDYSGLDSTFVNTLVLRWGIGTLIYQRFFFLMPSAAFTEKMVVLVGQRIRFEILRGIIRHPYGAICKADEASIVGEVPDSGAESITFKFTYFTVEGRSYVAIGASATMRITVGDRAFLEHKTVYSDSEGAYVPLSFMYSNPYARENVYYFSYSLYEDVKSQHVRDYWYSSGTRAFAWYGDIRPPLMIFALGEQ